VNGGDDVLLSGLSAFLYPILLTAI